MKANIEIIEKKGITIGDEFNMVHYTTEGFYKVNDQFVIAYLMLGVLYTLSLQWVDVSNLFQMEEENEIIAIKTETNTMDGEVFLKALSIVLNKEKYKEL